MIRNTAHSRPRRPLRLLAVEDSEPDFELLEVLLRSSDFEVTATRVEDEGGMLAALAAQPWDLVISDHHLPRFSSAGAIRTLQIAGLDIPLIIVSGVIGEEAAVEAMLQGADDFVMKANPRRLIPSIERSLDSAAARREKRRAEAAEREVERRFGAVTRNLPGAVLRLAYDVGTCALRVSFVSEGAAQLCGHPAAALAATPDLFLERIDAEDRSRLTDHVSRAASQRTGLRWEGRLHPLGGATPRWVLLLATPSDEGAWDGVAIDITPQKQIERELRESKDALRALTTHMERLKEAERAELARELHDEVGGLLTALKVDIATLARHAGDPEKVAEKIADFSELLEKVVASIKAVAKSLRPAILDHGLSAALEWQARDFEKRMGIPTRFKSNDENLKLDLGQSTGVFRVFQEALTNVAKHAEAKSLAVEVFAQKDTVSFEIRDDGLGFEISSLAKPDSFGILGMRERVHRMGGWIDVSTTPGRGTTLMMSIPRDPPEGAPECAP